MKGVSSQAITPGLGPIESKPTHSATRLENSPNIQTAPDSFKGKILSFFSNIPLLKETSTVKSYVDQVAKDNNNAIRANTAKLTAFIDTLSHRYGPQATTRAVQILAVNGKTKLTPDTMKALTAEAIHAKSAGETKSLARQMVVRIWPYESLSRPGHVSLTMKNSLDPTKNSATSTHMSWWPGERDDSLINMFSRVKAEPKASYQDDKRAEISSSAAKKLSEGTISPRGNQKQDKEGAWGVKAEKLYLPLAGNNYDRQTNTTSPRLFGLNEQLITSEWAKVNQENEAGVIGYKMVSATENCSGMAERLLRAGGAESFLPLPLSTIASDPNKVHDYVNKLQRTVENLNTQANELDEFFDKNKLGPPSAPATLAPLDVLKNSSAGASGPTQLDAKARKLEQILAHLPPSEAKTFSNLKNALSQCKAANCQTYPGLVMQTKALVEAMHDLMNAAPNAQSQGFGNFNVVMAAANEVLGDLKGMVNQGQD